MKNALDLSLSLWLQPACMICKGFTTYGVVCEKCSQFPPVAAPLCLICGDSLSFERDACGKCEKQKRIFYTTRSSYWLSDIAQVILHEIKFRSDHPTLSFLIDTHLPRIEFPKVSPETWVIPVPLSDSSLFERGFNQSESLAERVAEELGLKLVRDALIKIKKTERQSWLNLKERQKNLKNAFVWNKKYTPPSSVLLIDDVYTTGSTLRECAKVCKKKNVQTVTAWTLFRTPKK